MWRCKHVKSRVTTVYFKLGRLGRVSTYVQQMWGIRSHVTVEAGKHSRNRWRATTVSSYNSHRSLPLLLRIYFLFFDKFNGLKSIVLLILIKSFLWDMYAMVLPSTEFATIIIASLILYYGYKLFYDTITSYMLLYTFSIKSTLRTWSTFSH